MLFVGLKSIIPGDTKSLFCKSSVVDEKNTPIAGFAEVYR